MFIASRLQYQLQNRAQVPGNTVGRSPPIEFEPLDREI